jgi:TolB-like protein
MIECLSPAEQSELEELTHRDPFTREALGQVERIIDSRHFRRVQQHAKDFLRFVVAKALLGLGDQIKETTIAMAVFEESADFDPALTSKVRVAAADLRQRLAAYADQEGRHDLIQILLPLNTYVPEIHDRRVAVAIRAFENWHPHGEQQYLCAAISAEIAHQLCVAGLRAGPPESLRLSASRRQYSVRGSVESRDALLRINVSFADPATGRILCSRSFEGLRAEVLKLTHGATEAILEALVPEDDDHRPVQVSQPKQSQ